MINYIDSYLGIIIESIHSLNVLFPSIVHNLIETFVELSSFPSEILKIDNSIFYSKKNVLFICLKKYREATFNLE